MAINNNTKNSMKTNMKRLSKPFFVLIPMLAVSFLFCGLAKADYRGYGYSSYKKPSHSKHYKKPGYGSHYNKGHYSKKYSPKKYSVSVRLGNYWVTKYVGTSYSSALSVAKYWRSRGVSVRF